MVESPTLPQPENNRMTTDTQNPAPQYGPSSQDSSIGPRNQLENTEQLDYNEDNRSSLNSDNEDCHFRRRKANSPHSDSDALSDLPTRPKRTKIEQVQTPPAAENIRRRPAPSDSEYESDSELGEIVLRVTNLAPRPSTASLKDGLYHEFKKFGKLDCLVVAEVNGERQALVLFSKNGPARKALTELTGKRHMGSPMDIEIASDLEPRDVQKYGSLVDDQNPRASRTLFVGQIHPDTDERLLRRTFKEFGSIVDIEIKRNPQTGEPQYAFLQYDSIHAVVAAIKNKDGERLLEMRIKCGFGKTMQHEVLWLDSITDHATEQKLLEEFHRYQPQRILLDKMKGRALIYFQSAEIVKQVLYECKTRILAVIQARVKMDYASKSLMEDFKNNMTRTNQVTTGFVVDENEYKGLPALQPTIRPLPIQINGLQQPQILPHPSTLPEHADIHRRDELERKLEDLKRENIKLLNQMTNEKAANGSIDSIHVAVCDNANVLRSMEIHRLLAHKRELAVQSFGADKKVRISADATTEIEFDYKMSYLDIASGISKMKDHNEAFKRNGTIELLAKNRELKQGPENFLSSNTRFDIVFTTEYYLIDKVIGLLDKLVARGQIPDPVSRNNGFGSTCHVINIDIGDFREDAILGAQIISKLMEMIIALPEPDRQIPKLIKRFKRKSGTDIQHIAVQLH